MRKEATCSCITCSVNVYYTSLRSCPLPIIPLSLSREEGMIHFSVGSHVKKPESGLFSDWTRNNTDDLRCSNWPKCRHPLVVVDFSLHFCLCHEQWIHTRIFSISLYTKKLQSKIYRSFECNLIPATSYRSDKWVHFSNNQFMNGILTWFDCNSSFRNHAANYSERSSLSQHLSVRKIWCFSLIFFFTAFGTERSQRALTSKFFIICSC